MKIVTLTKHNQARIIVETVKTLEEGGLVVFPSDTVYGLLVDATNEKAVRKLIEFKERPAGKAISVFCNLKMVDYLVKVDDRQREVMKEIFPGPYTVVLPSKHKVCRLLESEKGSLGIRIPLYQLINQLIQTYGKPVTATSANLSNRSPHHSIGSLFKNLSQKKKKLIDLVVDAGRLPRNKPSTVIDLTRPEIKILRQGDRIFAYGKKYLSRSPQETQSIAKKVLKEILPVVSKQPVVFILEGELGTGKTVFTKGLGEALGIKNIISPSFVIYYEYQINDKIIDKFIHIDLYNITEDEEFKYLRLDKYLKPGNILVFEWGEKAGEIFNLLKNKAKIVYVKMKYVNKITREIKVKS